MIPVSVITGYLGSGKTTLLARLLREPSMGRTAVIVNEFGEIPLDHELIETSDESFVQLSNGCLCCNVRSDLTLTLNDLAARRAQGSVPPFERVVIETSGLADPAPILHALMTDRDLAAVYALCNVVTTVDAVAGAATLERYEEPVRQIAFADTIVVTKTDSMEAQPRVIAERVAHINSEARVLEVVRGDIGAPELFGESSHREHTSRARSHRDSLAALGMTCHREPETGSGVAIPWRTQKHAEAHAHTHTSGITTFGIVREEPLHAATLPLFLSALAENCGADLLRVKGIVNVAEEPQRPAVIHGVQHVYHAPEWLERWPSNDRRTRIVFIARDIPERWVQTLIDLIDEEVADTSRSITRA